MAKAVLSLRDQIGHGFERVLELGSQTLTANLAIDPKPTTVPEFYSRTCGTQLYDSIDTDGRGTKNLDLNCVHDLGATYDLVTNNGTGEHIFNQAAVFETIHHACKAGGTILCVQPWINWRNHAFFNLHPCLFRDIAIENGYELIEIYGATRDGDITHDHIDFSEDKNPQPTGKNISLVVAMRKGPNAPFMFPTHGKYRKTEPTINFHNIFKSASVVLEPFPHAVFTLDKGLFDKLDSLWPELQVIEQKEKIRPNVLLQYSAKESLGAKILPNLWREMISYLTSADALQEYLRLFGSEALKRYPLLSSLPLECGVRGRDSAPFLMDAQFAINTPVKKRSSVRGPHIDDPLQLFGGMIYFSGNELGGNLELYRWRKEHKFWKRRTDSPGTGKKYLKASECEEAATECMATIETVPGTIVLFLNTLNSIHGVTPREKTDQIRRYLNLVVEVRQPLFELK